MSKPTIRRRLLSVVVAVLVAVTTLTVAASPAHAGYWQKCNNTWNGTLCIDINGTVGGAPGKIGVGYWKTYGADESVMVGWAGPTGEHWTNTWQYMNVNENTGTWTWTSYLGHNCTHALLKISNGGIFVTENLCI